MSITTIFLRETQFLNCKNVSKALKNRYAAMAQLVEHVLGKDEVTGSNPVSSSKKKRQIPIGACRFLLFHYSLFTESATDSRGR